MTKVRKYSHTPNSVRIFYLAERLRGLVEHRGAVLGTYPAGELLGLEVVEDTVGEATVTPLQVV